MKRNIFWVVFIILLFSASAFAGDFSGSLTYSGQYNFAEHSLGNTLSLDLNYIHSFTDEIYLEGDLVIRYSDKSSSSPVMIIPKEIYIGTYDFLPGLDLNAGMLVVNWGSADMLSPLDNFNPSPPLISFSSFSSKNGVWAIDATYYFDDVTYLQGVYLPRFTPSYIPESYEKQLYLSMFSPQFEAQGIDISGINLSRNLPEKPAWGAKLSRSFTSFDAALSYYSGYYFNAYPESVIPVPDVAGFSLDMELGYPKKNVFGFEFQGDFPGIEGATLRGDIAYIVPQPWEVQGEYLLKDPYWKAAIGADYTTSSNLYLNAGYIWGFATEEGAACSPYIFLNVNKELEDSKFKPSYMAGISLRDWSMLNNVGVSYNVNDDLSLTLSCLFIVGDETSKFGQMKSTEGIFLTGEWTF